VWLLSVALATSACVTAKTADRVARGDKAMSQGEPAKAAKEYEQAAKDAEVTVDVLIKLGRARQDSGDKVGAAEAYTHALQRAPECQRCFAFLGVLAIDDRQFDRAETLLRNALLLDPEDTVAATILDLCFSIVPTCQPLTRRISSRSHTNPTIPSRI
jgi:Flp pilus assembly protein TadD